MITIERRKILAAAVFTALASRTVRAQGFPNRSMKIIVPFPAGGPVDGVARALSVKLADALGQSVLVENRPGGNTMIGTDAVAKAPADGYTLLMTVPSFVTTPLLYKTPYDIAKDFAPVAFVAQSPLLVVINKDLPITSMRELVQYAGKNPQKINFGVGSIGAPGHLAQEVFKLKTKMPMMMVGYKGSTPMFQDILAGVIVGAFEPVLGVLPLVQSGRLRALAVTGPNRIAALPDLPTLAEAGYPGLEAFTWYGLWAPAGTPPDVVERINLLVNQSLRSPDMRERLEKAGFEISPGRPAAFAERIRLEAIRSKEVVRAANIKPE